MPIIEDPDERTVRAAAFEMYCESLRASAAIQADYGRWIVTTLTATHAAGIYMVANAANLPADNKIIALWCLVLGLVLSFLTGLFAWLNWSYSVGMYWQLAKPRMLIDDSYPEPVDKNTGDRLGQTFRSAVLFGISSVAMFIGAMTALSWR